MVNRKNKFPYVIFYYLFRLYLIFISLVKLAFFFFHLSAIRIFGKKIIAALLAYYSDTKSNLLDFRQSDFYKKREGKLCWVEVSALSVSWGNLDGQEIIFLSTIVSEIKPGAIFEFGTYGGYTTIHLSKNAPPECLVYTIDLPSDNDSSKIQKLSLTQAYDDISTIEKAKNLKVGSIFTQNKEHKNIIQLFGDTLSYDFSPWHNKIDLCFIDASHSYQCVKSDTENAFKMLSEKGILIWHDFDLIHYDVFRYLNEIAKSKKLFCIQNTRLAVYFNS